MNREIQLNPEDVLDLMERVLMPHFLKETTRAKHAALREEPYEPDEWAKLSLGIIPYHHVLSNTHYIVADRCAAWVVLALRERPLSIVIETFCREGHDRLMEMLMTHRAEPAPETRSELN